MPTRFPLACLLLFSFSGAAQSLAAEPRPDPDAVSKASPLEQPVDFAREVRSILADTCYHCHGPDQDNREAGLRLDSFEAATEDLGGYAAIVPGDATESEVWIRITSEDEDLVMPPPNSGKSLSSQDVQLLRRWIDQGAQYAPHWAFTPPKKLLPPKTVPAAGSNEIDRFVLEKLAHQGLSPSPQADRRTLIRRLSLDLTGLPPSPQEVDAFLADDSADAYSKLVERLLASKHHGERWGRIWLDAARYADSDGFEKDKPRFVHFYRDWVCDALNQDMPFDQFVIRQIAGDLLPNPTQDDFVATGFLRNSMINEEGGINPEQFRMEAMYDRMDAIGKSVLGLTIQCAQCHTHKYDPISQTEYYSMFAMLNNCHEAAITVYNDEERERLSKVQQQLTALRDRILQEVPELAAEFQSWIQETAGAIQDSNSNGPWEPLEIDFNENTIGGQKFLPQGDGSYLAQGYAPTRANPTGDAVVESRQINTVRLELLRDPNLPHGGPGRSVDGTWTLSEIQLSYSVDHGQSWKPVKFSEAVSTIAPAVQPLDARYHLKKPDPKRVTGPVTMAIDGDDNTAWTGTLGPGRRNDPHVGWFTLTEPIIAGPEQGLRLRISLKQRHGGWNSDDNQNHNLGRFRISVSDRTAPAKPIPPLVKSALLNSSDDNHSKRARLLDHYISTRPELADWSDRLDEIWQKHPVGTSQLVVLEREVPRKTYRLERGDFLSPREEVSGAVPEFLHPLPENSSPPNRLDLARWLVDPNSPTTARAIVNRVWQAYFGVGLTATPDDLGLQGEPPTHPELLDWLAVDLMENQWSLKELHRRIVHSSTYRQSSKVTPELQQMDPENRMLARGPRFRVPAEMVRDIALKASGLLNPEIGGRPVFPPAPSFLFTPPASYGPKTWDYEDDAQKYRRGFYTFRFRSVPYPAFQAFDAPTGEVACVRRSRSNTPLQALVTLNEPLFVECAQHLARSLMDQGLRTDEERFRFVFEHCLSRQPDESELSVLQHLLSKQRNRLANEVEMAMQLATAGSDENRYEVIERAAWTAVCRVVLNLDETITKQ